MAKAHQKSEFRFKRTDTIGAASAEDDAEFLKTCFVETGDYDVLKDQSDIRQIVLGRTGSGKSALFERLKQEEERVISIDPHDLALTYVSNSSVIRYFSELGVNLDPFFKLLWRHVLIVEVLNRHFESHASGEDKGLWKVLLERFARTTKRDKSAREAVQYLREWGEKFWVETEYRVREITTKLEDKLAGQLEGGMKTPVLSTGGTLRTERILSDEEKLEVVERGQRVVSEAQVQDLSKIIGLLRHCLSDEQKSYYVLIDRLDEDWIEEKLRYRLIMALLESLKEISRVGHVKVLVAIRRDLIDRVFRSVRDTGFQEEKYHSLYLPLHWSPRQIIELLDRRVHALVTRRYEKKKRVTHRDLLPRRVYKKPIAEFIAARAQRPRDVISFFNKCIEAGDGMPRLSVDALKSAEGDYSRQRLRALGDEWYADHQGLLDFAEILKNRPQSFALSQIEYDDVSELCLQSAINCPGERGILRQQARSVADGLVDVESFKRTMFMVFYKIGLIGLKLESFESASWVGELGQGVSPSEIDDNTKVVVHPTYQRALGIGPKRTR